MLHLDSVTNFADPIKSSNISKGHEANDKSTTRKHKIVQISSLHDLTFEKFLYTDMKKFDARVADVQDNVFTPTEFLVEIRVSNIPPFQIGKTYEEFRAFYKALKLRFPNISWPEFPPSFQFVKKIETRRNTFNQILEEICTVAKMQDTYKKSILGIFYAFFLDPQVSGKAREQAKRAQQQLEKSETRDTVTTKEDNAETESNKDDSFQAHLNSFENRHQDLRSEASKDGSTFAEENGERRESFYSETGRKMSFLSSNVDESKQRRHSVENYSMPNLDSSDIKLGSSPADQTKQVEELRRSYDNVETMVVEETPISFRKMSIEEQVVAKGQQSPSSNVQQSETSDTLSSAEKNKLSSSNASIDNNKLNVEADLTLGKSSPKFSPVAEEVVNFSRGLDYVRSVVEVPNKATEEGAALNQDKPVETGLTSSQEKGDKEANIEQTRDGKKLVPFDLNRCLEKEIPNFTGNIHVRLASESKWNKYFARIQKSCLLLYPTILDNFPHHFIPCYKAVIKYVDNPSDEHIEFYHHYDAEKFQIMIDPENTDQNDLYTTGKNLKVWAAQLKIASQKTTDLDLEEYHEYNPVGKLQFVVCDAKNIKSLPPKSSCLLRIKHKPYVLQTSKALSGETMRWKQSFFLPICDVFFPITLELVCAYNDGWITGSQKEEVICSFDIPVQDLMSMPYNDVLELNFPFKYTEARKAKILKSLNISENELAAPQVRLKITNISSVKSYFAPPYGDYVEGVKMDTDKFTKQYLKLSIARIRRIISYFILVARQIRDVYHHKYPFFSYLCILLSTYFFAVLQVSDIIPGALLLLAMLCFYKHPKVEPVISSFMIQHFFQDKHLNPYYKHRQIKTMFEVDLEETFNTEKWKYKLVDDESIVSQLKKAKSTIVILTIILTKIAGFFEKMKNIVLWQDPRRTIIFVIVTVMGYCIFAIVPMRFLILIGIWSKFAKGIFYFKTLRHKNRQAATIVINYVFQKYFNDYHNQIVNNPTEPWPTNISMSSLQRKMVDQLKYRLDVDVSDDLLQTYKSPEELISALESCNMHLKINKDVREEGLSKPSKQKDPKFTIDNLFYFIMNIPSDYYRVIQPKVVDIQTKKVVQ